MTSPSRSWLSWPVVALAMVALFAFTIVLRLPYLEMTMGMHHDEGTARTLVHGRAWEANGPTAEGYLLRRTQDRPGDRYLTSAADADGVEYYYSMPPGHPLLAYAALKLTGSALDVANVRVFNLVLHAICALLAYFLAAELARSLRPPWARVAGLVAFTAYLFAPTALWYQSNAYLSASAVQPFFMACMLAILVALRRGATRPVLGLVGAFAFLMAYTEWVGLAFAGVAVLLAVIRRRDAVVRAVCIAGAIGGFAGGAVFLAQYGFHLGLDGLMDVVANRYALRSGIDDTSMYSLWSWEGWRRVASHYRYGLASVIALLGVFGAWAWWTRRRDVDADAEDPAQIGLVATLMLAPIAIHHLVLFDHTAAHSFDVLKTAVPLAVFAGLLAGRIGARYAGASRWTVALVAGTISTLTVASAIWSVWLFADVRTVVPPPYDEIGAAIEAGALDDEVVFVDSPIYLPRSIITYYGGRDWLRWPKDAERTAAILARDGGRTGIVVTTGTLGTPMDLAYVGADGTTYAERSDARATLDEASDD